MMQTQQKKLETCTTCNWLMQAADARGCQKAYLVAVAKALMVDRPMPGIELTFRLRKLPLRATAATALSETFVHLCSDNTCIHAAAALPDPNPL